MYSSNLVKHHSICSEIFYDIPSFEALNHRAEVFEWGKAQVVEEETVCSTQVALDCCQAEANDILNKAQAEAIEILAAAQKKAEAILSQAETNSKEIYEKNYRLAQSKGYSDGVQQGKTEVEKQTDGTLTELLSISSHLVSEREDFVNSNRNVIIDLAAQMAQKIVGENFMMDKGAFFALFQQVVREIPTAEKLVVTVSGKDYKIKTFDFEQLQELAKGFSHIELRCDNTAEMGTLRLETAVMVLDASINTQIGLLKKEISSAI